MVVGTQRHVQPWLLAVDFVCISHRLPQSSPCGFQPGRAVPNRIDQSLAQLRCFQAESAATSAILERFGRDFKNLREVSRPWHVRSLLARASIVGGFLRLFYGAYRRPARQPESASLHVPLHRRTQVGYAHAAQLRPNNVRKRARCLRAWGLFSMKAGRASLARGRRHAS